MLALSQLEPLLAGITHALHLSAAALILIALSLSFWRAVRGPNTANRLLGYFQLWLCLIGLIGVVASVEMSFDLLEVILGVSFVLAFSVLLAAVKFHAHGKSQGQKSSYESIEKQ